MNLSPEARQALQWATTAATLRRFPQGFRPAPGVFRAPRFSRKLIDRLIDWGYLAWGNASRSYARITQAGRQALEAST